MELMYHHDAVELPVEPGGVLAVGDDVALAAGSPLAVFGLGRVTSRTDADLDPDDPDAPEPGDSAAEALTVRYTHRVLDTPLAYQVATPPRPGHPQSMDATGYSALVAQAGSEHAVTAPRTRWLVGVDLPIEASSPAEAVRQFWTYVTELGPSELPAFVSPADDELRMQVYVLGEEANLDPEEEEDE